MKRIKILVKHKGGKETWEEELDCPEGISYEKEAKEIIRRFNNSLSPKERPRELIKVLSELSLPPNHDWIKGNLITMSNSRGMYDEYQCQVCRITGKRFGLGGTIVRDKKYRSEKYRYCRKEVVSSDLLKELEEAKRNKNQKEARRIRIELRKRGISLRKK